jgi:hypothetical protein
LFLFGVLVLGLAVGLAAGGRLRGLLLERFRFVGLLPAWLAIVALPQVLVLAGFQDWPTGTVLTVARLALAAVGCGLPVLFLLLNLIPSGSARSARRPPVRPADRVGLSLMLVGAVATAVVVLANGGAMPVDPGLLDWIDNPAEQYGLLHGLYLDRTLVGPGTVLPWLARTIPLPVLPADPPFLSPGEIVAAVGLLLLVLSSMSPYDRWNASDRAVSPPRFPRRRRSRGRRRS